MKGIRKLVVGLTFLLCVTFLGYNGIKEKTDLVGLSTVIGAIAIGVGTTMWGNAQEHKQDAANKATTGGAV